MTTRFHSIGSLRALAAARRRGHLAGGSAIIDRDLARVASDALAFAHADAGCLATAADRHDGFEPAVTTPIDLGDRRARGVRPNGSTPTPPRVRAS